MKMKLFDDGYSSPRSEGNLPFRADSYLESGTTRHGGDYSWSAPRIPRTSILSRFLPDIVRPEIPSPTLNSFAAFTDIPGSFLPYQGTRTFKSFFDIRPGVTYGAFAAIPSDAKPVVEGGYSVPGYKYSASTGSYYDPNGNAISADDLPAMEPIQAPVATGNSILDSISGAIRSITPAAVTRITGQAVANPQSQSNLMQQYLQGKLPGYEINPSTGQLQPKSSIAPLAIAGVGIGLLLLFIAKR
jgi:hypothetical protein